MALSSFYFYEQYKRLFYILLHLRRSSWKPLKNWTFLHMKKFHKISVSITIQTENVFHTRPVITCPNSIAEALEKVLNMFKVSYKETKTTSMNSSFSTDDFEHLNVGWVMNIFPINSIVHKSQIHEFNLLLNLPFMLINLLHASVVHI